MNEKNTEEKKHYCYILQCADGTLYTGYTTDPKQREKTHNLGKGAKYTKTRRPCKLIHIEEFATKQEAMQREYYIKHHMTRQEKLALVENFKSIE